ncbi:unknown [Singapore grouper iridovirus]|uniref:Uncharacterized protein n=1 Tax=Singapore grouper iridovirus TaxID=262968 RepID=Q5YFH6_9VIRU|nr:hypothetical protein ORF089L [Singapore grouper iridovirus]AAS18104.1 unknown [Singapore grouper iridovirus]WAU86798.1 hypothetical protein ORF089L [Singapore grouper iridovirus]
MADWLVSRMLRYPKGGILNTRPTMKLVELVRERVFPKNRGEVLIVTSSDKKDYWHCRGYNNVYTATELGDKTPRTVPPYSFIWTEDSGVFVNMENLIQFLNFHDSPVVKWLCSPFLKPRVLRAFSNDQSYVPCLALPTPANEVVSYPADETEIFIMVLYAKMCGEIKHDNVDYYNSTHRHPEEAALWPEVILSKIMLAGPTERFFQNLLSATSKQEILELGLDINERELSLNEKTFRTALLNRFAEYSFDQSQYLTEDYETSTMVDALRKRILEEPQRHLVLVERTSQLKYLRRKLPKNTPITLFRKFTPENPPSVIFLPMSNLSNNITSLELKRQLNALVLERPSIKIVAFKSVNNAFLEMLDNCVYNMQEETYKLDKWNTYVSRRRMD